MIAHTGVRSYRTHLWHHWPLFLAPEPSPFKHSPHRCKLRGIRPTIHNLRYECIKWLLAAKSSPLADMFAPSLGLSCFLLCVLFVLPGQSHVLFQDGGKGPNKLAAPTTVKGLLNSEKKFGQHLEKANPGFLQQSAASQSTFERCCALVWHCLLSASANP